MRIIVALFIFTVSSCSTSKLTSRKGTTSNVSSRDMRATRLPSSADSGACVDLIAETLRLGHNLDPASWQADTLAQKGLINLDQLDTFQNSKYWHSVIDESGSKSAEELEMSFTILAILKKMYPSASEVNLKERLGVLINFCG